MEVLKQSGRATLATALALAIAASGCGPINSITETIPLDTDTYISSSDPSNHSELPYLDVSKSGSAEERIITKLPTTDQDSNDVVSQTLEDLFVILFFMPVAILSDLLSCESQIVQPANLTSAYLVFDIGTNTQSLALDGLIQLRTLSKPWFQSVSWTRAHPFSGRGLWTTPGGDTDPSFFPVQAASTGTNSIQFDITNYFKSLILANGQAVHYGFLLESTSGALPAITLESTQYSDTSARPRLVSTYTGSCTTSDGSDTGFRLRRRTTILGKKPIVIDELLDSAGQPMKPGNLR